MTEGLSTRNLTAGYGRQPVLKDVTAVLPPRRFTVLAGPNGSGKSTLLRALAGSLRPGAGEVTLDGRPLSGWSPRARARRIGLLPQAPQAPEGLRVADLVAHGRNPHRGLLSRWSPADRAACDEALHRTGMAELAQAPLESLSGGQRQRAWIALALAQQSDILLLDEPTAFLDLAHQLEVLHLIADLVTGGRTVVAVLHDLNQAARHADHVIVMQSGRIATSGPAAAALRPEVLRCVFGVEVTEVQDPDGGRPVLIPRLPR